MKNKGCLIALGIVLILATAGLAYYFSSQGDGDEAGVEYVKPEIDDIVEKTVASGSIKPRQEVDIKPQVSGVIDQIYVEEGQLVKKGDKIARIKLIPSEVNINSAQSNVQLAKLRLDEAKRELSRQKQVNTQNLDVENARLSYENARDIADRQRKLFNEGVISKQDLEQAEMTEGVQKAAFENAKLNSGNSVQQFATDLDVRKQEYQAALNNLQLLREGATRNSGQVSNVILSTVNGMVLDLPLKEGSSVVERNTFNEGTSIATIANMNDLIFEGTVDEADVGRLSQGMNVLLKVGAIKDAEISAVLEHISPKGVDEEGAIKFEVRASVEAPDSMFLRAGYSANGDIILNEVKDVVAVNERDVIYEGDSTLVELKINDEETERKLIDLGISDGLQVQVLSGLDTTDYIKKQRSNKNED